MKAIILNEAGGVDKLIYRDIEKRVLHSLPGIQEVV